MTKLGVNVLSLFPFTVLLATLLLGCGTSEHDTDPLTTGNPTGINDSGTTSTQQGNTVTFTVYVDDMCTELPPIDSVVLLNATKPCNETPDASISELVCLSDRITYTNHPNNNDCSTAGIPNELIVGACQEFPGPVPTWKLIEADSYTCLTAGA
ncbi:MAG: hypothetical protein GWP91_10200 [Rhodobacterales bacterium]|nr:hypothetical protein [Rhodobacterales bacterium]